MRRIVGWLLPLGLAASTLAAAQTYTPPTAADFQNTINSAGAAATNSNISATVPGYGGDAPDLQAHAGDSPSQLQSYGTTQMSNSTLTPIMTSNNQYKANNVIDANTSWVQNALGVQNNPDATAGNAAGSGNQACSTTQQPVTTHSLYTCNTGNVVQQNGQTCTLQYTPTIKEDYIYTCTSNWVDGQGALVPDVRCGVLAVKGQCSLQAQSCTTSSTTGTYSYSCSTGQQYTPTTPSCTTNTTASTYTYVCSANWVDGQGQLVPDIACSALATSGICSQTGSTCVQGASTETQSYSCFAGTQHTPSNPTCTTTHNVGTTNQYQYQCDRSEFFDRYAAVPNVDSMVYIEECIFGYSHSGNVQTDYGCGYIQTQRAGHCAGGDQFKPGYYIYMCDAPFSVNGTSNQGTINNACFTYSQNATCHEVPPANCAGMMYNVWCRANIHTYQCTGQVGASAPTATIPTYSDLGTDSSQCNSLATNSACQQTGSSCASTMDPQIAAALGLPAGTCSNTTVNYTCDNTSFVNYCTGTAPTGSGWTSSTANICHASGSDTCGINETQYTWIKQQGVGGCQKEQRNYTCSGDVPAADPAATINLSTDSSQCQALASNSACHATGTTCAHMTNYSAQQLAAMGKTAQFCDQQTTTYSCDGYTAVNSCTGSAPSGSGWTCTPTNSCQASGSDPCAITVTTYNCSRQQGVGGCQQATLTYDCSVDVPEVDPYQNLIKTVTGGTWAYSPACAAASASNCVKQTSTCTDTTPTKTVNGVQVSASCWQQTESYTCETTTGTASDCAPAPSCTLKSQSCLSDPQTPIASCSMVENTYDCTSTTSGPSQTSCSASWVNGQQTITAQDDPDNNFAQAMAAINSAQSGSQSYQNAPDLKIFNGDDLRCKKAIFGLYNCCKDSGLLLGNLVSCSADEKKLYQEQSNTKACHYVGTYCSSKSLFGTCLEKKMTYCCYGGTLARIIQEAGHSQLNKTWGDAKSPQCGGFSVAEFQQLDLTNVDFSDFYNEKLGTLSNGDPNSTVAAITASLNTMAANKTSKK
jgi:conjugal transfer mating pair stabilization protein TraN